MVIELTWFVFVFAFVYFGFLSVFCVFESLDLCFLSFYLSCFIVFYFLYLCIYPVFVFVTLPRCDTLS